MADVAGVILAGGRATRMGGGNKGLREINGQPMLSHVIERLRPQCGPMAINANGDPAALAAYDLPVLPDSLPDHPGPLAGVLAGLDWAAEHGFAQIVTVAVDTPFFPTNLVERLKDAAGSSGMALAGTREDGRTYRHPTFGLWPTRLRDDLRRAITEGTRKVVIWTDQHDAGLAMFDSAGGDPFFNVNTPEDLATAEGMIQA